jgi:hypothetical protein
MQLHIRLGVQDHIHDVKIYCIFCDTTFLFTLDAFAVGDYLIVSRGSSTFLQSIFARVTVHNLISLFRVSMISTGTTAHSTLQHSNQGPVQIVIENATLFATQRHIFCKSFASVAM